MKVDGYNFGQKNNYRRWLWGHVRRALQTGGKKTKNCVVLYLPGMEDLDRGEALKRGFSPDNLIAVDLSQHVVDKIRSEGGFAVRGDIADVALLMRDRVDVIIADFCGGATLDMVHLIGIMTSLKGGTVVAVNLLRGRDYIENLKKWHERFCVDETVLPQKHRGHWFAATYASFLMVLLNGIGQLDCYREFLRKYYEETRPSYFSYRSRTQVFDSCVITIGLGGNAFSKQNWDFHSTGNIAGRVAALLAHRTRRMCA